MLDGKAGGGEDGKTDIRFALEKVKAEKEQRQTMLQKDDKRLHSPKRRRVDVRFIPHKLVLLFSSGGASKQFALTLN